MFEVYLAGRIDGLSYEEAMRERERVTRILIEHDIMCRNPLRGRKCLQGVDKVDNSYEMSIQEIIQRDLHDIDKANAVLVITGDAPSYGTMGEFWYATWIAKKPTLVVSPKNNGKKNWVGYYATKIVSSMDEAIEVLKDWALYWDDGAGVYDTY